MVYHDAEYPALFKGLKVVLTFHCSFMGRGVIDFPVGRIAQCILNIEQMHHWERYLTVGAPFVQNNLVLCVIF